MRRHASETVAQLAGFENIFDATVLPLTKIAAPWCASLVGKQS